MELVGELWKILTLEIQMLSSSGVIEQDNPLPPQTFRRKEGSASSPISTNHALPGEAARDDDPWEGQLRFGETRGAQDVGFDTIRWDNDASVNASRTHLIGRCP